MRTSKRCPECGELMVETFRPVSSDDDGTWYTFAYNCPRESEHGTLTPCENCGRPARSSRQHYSFRPGVLGSGKWSCISKEQQDNVAQTFTKHAINKALEDTLAPCSTHKLTQHRDRKPPWCDECGRDARGQKIGRTRAERAVEKEKAFERPHFFKGNLHDDKCTRCGLPRWRTDDVHSDDAIQAELDRLYGLEDYLARP